MIRAISLILAFVLLAPALAEEFPKETLELIRKIPHSGYSEGIDWHEGFIWHTLPTEILKIDPKDGTVVQRFPPASEYNESPAWFKGKLYVLSYSDNNIYVGTLKGDKLAFEKKGIAPNGEAHGWGITHDGKSIIISGNYSSNLYYLDPSTLELEKTLKTNVVDIEDLAWDGSGFWASSFTHYRGCIFHISASTGKVNKLYELPEPDNCPVIDGMAYDGKSLWVTGKHCPSIYNVKRPSLGTQRKLTAKP